MRTANSFDLFEATTALACTSGKVRLVVQLKREIGKLWEDASKAPYKELFKPDVRDALNARKQCMRKRYQQGSVTKSSDGRYWIGKYREDGRHKTKLLGKIREITKSEAQEKFAEFLKLLNGPEISPDLTLKSFLEVVYFPFYQRKWKKSTAMTNRDRIQREIVASLGQREMRTFTRDELQTFLDSKSSLSFSTGRSFAGIFGKCSKWP